jgi:hypothetical protein
MLNQQAFEEGYTHGRQYYFEDVDEEEERDGTHPALTASSLLGPIATCDEHGRYQLDDGCNHSTFPNGVEELLGVLVGYLSGPLHPETQEERTIRLSACIVIDH